MYRRAGAFAIAVLAATAVLAPQPASAYPPGDDAYLDHTEMVATIRAVEAAHPQIVDLFTLGTSHQGRVLWAAKISDNVGSDEPEPEVLFDAGIHAREHMTTEMAVVLLRNLASGYGPNAAITDWVNGREIFILFNLNPDGSEYDHASGAYRGWRKNRQPTPNSLEIGTDINRNFGYQWGTSSANASPAVETYRGPSAWSTPEARAFRDFVDSRVVGGEQQITVHVTFHQFGRAVLYPYGYTPEDVPPDMSADDRATLEAMATEMARMSAYAPAQSADWAGINVGNQMDWMYAAHRIMTFTFEMGDAFYMPASAIGSETARNLEASYYAIEQADCPYAVVGLEAVYCDPSGFEDIAASPFKTEIRWAADVGITRGCARNLFCPSTPVTREQMASFLARALALPAASRDWFTDDDGSAHEDDINRVADAGVTLGCGGSRYCPTDHVTRQQMASFLRRAYSLPATGVDFFTDDEASEHEPDINRLAASGVTRGCTPTTYCPLAPVTREQMVTFLYRAEH